MLVESYLFIILVKWKPLSENFIKYIWHKYNKITNFLSRFKLLKNALLLRSVFRNSDFTLDICMPQESLSWLFNRSGTLKSVYMLSAFYGKKKVIIDARA